MEDGTEMLVGELRCGVGRNRLRQQLLVLRKLGAGTGDGARRRQDHAAAAGVARREEHIQGAIDIDGVRRPRIGDRAGHRDLGRLMEHHLATASGAGHGRRVAHIAHDDLDIPSHRGQVFQCPVEPLSRTRTRRPSRTSRVTMWKPMKPSPLVTRSTIRQRYGCRRRVTSALAVSMSARMAIRSSPLSSTVEIWTGLAAPMRAATAANGPRSPRLPATG